MSISTLTGLALRASNKTWFIGEELQPRIVLGVSSAVMETILTVCVPLSAQRSPSPSPSTTTTCSWYCLWHCLLVLAPGETGEELIDSGRRSHLPDTGHGP